MVELQEQRCAMTAENGQRERGGKQKAVKKNVLEVCTVLYLNSSVSVGQFV